MWDLQALILGVLFFYLAMSDDLSISTSSDRINPLISLSYHQARNTMKTKELSSQVRDEVVEKYRSEVDHKNIPEP